MYYVLIFKYNMWEVTAVCEYEQDAELIKRHKVLTNSCLVIYDSNVPFQDDFGMMGFNYNGEIIRAGCKLYL